MTRPALIGIGGHVVAALVEQLGAVSGLAEAVEFHLSPEMSGGRPRAAADVLGRAAIVLDEGGAMDPAERALLPPGCAVITLPQLEFASLWPQMAEHPARGPDIPSVARPFGDRIALGVAGAVADPAARRVAYDAVTLDMLGDPRLMHDAAMRAMFTREAGCDVRVAGFVLSRFRSERLFHSAVHPAAPVLEQMMVQLLGHPAIQALMSAPLDDALRAVVPGLAEVFADAQAPVMASIAAHFGLAWWSAGAQYRQGEVSRDGDGWVDWHLRGPAAAAEEPAMALHPAARITRATPFIATAIDPAIAPHGAVLLSAQSGQYTAPAVLVSALEGAIVLGHSAALRLDSGSDAVAQIDRPALLGFEAGWADDPRGMVGVLPRLLTFARLRRREPSLVLVLPDALTQAGWLGEMLALLGIAAGDIVWLADTGARLARLVLTSGLGGDDVSPFSTEAARDLAALVPLSGALPRRVYLRSADIAGRLVNEAELAAMLAAQGFALLDADQTSLVERIAVLRHTSAVVAAQGPALAELAFCPPGAAVLELVGPANPRLPFWSLASCAGLRYGYVVGEAVGEAAWDGDYSVPVAMVAYACGLMAAGDATG